MSILSSLNNKSFLENSDFPCLLYFPIQNSPLKIVDINFLLPTDFQNFATHFAPNVVPNNVKKTVLLPQNK